jgi:transcriptional regulator with XRE-family HTH domain
MVQGRKPDYARRAKMILLRAEGHTFAEIGRRLGVTRQSVQLTLKAAGKAALTPPIQCRQCARRIGERPYRGLAPQRVLCLRCVAAGHAEHFGDRLRAFRVAAGLSQAALGKLIGVTGSCVGGFETGAGYLRWNALVALMRVLGKDLFFAASFFSQYPAMVAKPAGGL